MTDVFSSPMLAVNWLIIAALILAGGRPEKFAGVLFAVLHLVTPWIDSLMIGDLRWAVALSSVTVFGVLLWLAMTRDRWWLVVAAGCQLLALSTHALAALGIERLAWAAVTMRWISWTAVLAAATFGLWEGPALDRLKRPTLREALDDA